MKWGPKTADQIAFSKQVASHFLKKQKITFAILRKLQAN